MSPRSLRRDSASGECWLVSPEAETVEVLRLSPEGAERAGLFGGGDRVHSELLPELELAVDRVFA
ncbi:MAG: Uma2 family endonuclease [Armatimonadetes bacterium]|nr:Uma2 family endonuclease [Armatimonadota bacterium]